MVWKSMFVATLIIHLISLGGGQNFDLGMLLKSSFPPARPSVNNLKAVCFNGYGRPRYPDDSFPSSSFAYARRAGKAVNRLEEWFSQCCYGGLALGHLLCCVEQAWETALTHFCIEEYSTMTLVHECCEKKGQERWDCFERKAANPSYYPLSRYRAPIIPSDSIFTWDPDAC